MKTHVDSVLTASNVFMTGHHLEGASNATPALFQESRPEAPPASEPSSEHFRWEIQSQSTDLVPDAFCVRSLLRRVQEAISHCRTITSS